MKPSLQFRLSQHLTLTPQLQQSIRLLQLSTVELNQEIDRILMENPALEREDAAEGGEHEAVPVTPVSSTPSAPAEPAPAETDWSAEVASNWRGSAVPNWAVGSMPVSAWASSPPVDGPGGAAPMAHRRSGSSSACWPRITTQDTAPGPPTLCGATVR